jgi:hypothetical protein
MSCMILFAQPTAVATTQFVRVLQCEDTSSCWTDPKAEHTSLSMSWVVVTDKHGKRQLRMRWMRDEDCSERQARPVTFL